MGFIKSFKKLLKGSDDGTGAAAAASPRGSASGSSPGPLAGRAAQIRDEVDGDGVRRVASSTSAESSSRPNPALAGVGGRIASFTSTARHETTVIERQGSRLILKEVKQLQPDPESDEKLLRPTTPAQAAVTDAQRYRRVGRVASLPMLLDAPGMPTGRRPPIDPNAIDAELDPDLAKELAQQSPGARLQGTVSSKRRGPPKRAESLKCLLKLDQYKFNADVSTLDAVEALGFEPEERTSTNADSSAAQTSGSLQDILTTDGRTSVLLAASPSLPHKMRRLKWSVEDYQLIKQLHKGYASDVYQARCKYSGELVALKVYKLKEQGDIQRMQLYREIKLHSVVEHNNIIQFLACFLENNRVILVQEFATGGDLLKYMYKCGGRLMERQAVGLVLQPFLVALHYLHTQGIVHRDIKPENVIFTENKTLKLADFGLAIDLKEERANTRAGTLDYMAPEVLKCPTKKTPDENKENPQSAHYHQSVDVWAVGVFAYELLVGVPPFKANQMIDTARNIIHAPVHFPDSISELAKDFIQQALRKHAGDRPTVLEMLHHPWVTMYQRRSSVRVVYTRSNSLMELVANTPAPPGRPSPAAAAGPVSGDSEHSPHSPHSPHEPGHGFDQRSPGTKLASTPSKLSRMAHS